MEIKNTTSLESLFREYPQLEQNIALIHPSFSHLIQSALRENVLKITTIEHVARKADREVTEVIRELLNAVGISVREEKGDAESIRFLEEDPQWIRGVPSHRVDGTEMLTQGIHPLGYVSERMENLDAGELLLLTTNFQPQPLVESMQGRGYKVYTRKDVTDQNLQLTFIGK